MSNRAPKRPRARQQPTKPQSKKWLVSIWGAILALATLLGFLALIPRLTVTISDPPDPNDPFSAPVTVSNTGYLPLESVVASFSMGDVKDSTGITMRGEPGYKTRIIGTPLRAISELGMDGQYQFSITNILNVPSSKLEKADIAIVIDYELPIIHIKREKIFPFYAVRQYNGTFKWFPNGKPN